jgi:hypothetical protein
VYLEVSLQSIKSLEAFLKMEHPCLQAFLFFDMFHVFFFQVILIEYLKNHTKNCVNSYAQ